MDEMVVRAQRFINAYNVADIPKVEENGKTSWTVMYALTRALQYELGIGTLSDSFGPTTLSTLQSRFPVIDGNTRHGNIYRIVQSGLYCKGYDGGEIDGTYNERVSAAVVKLKQNMGVARVYPGDGLTPKVFKALLTMDPYVVVEGGTEQIRSVQQWMNGRYVARRNFFIIPCDGNFSRDVQKALMLAIQFEIGMSDDVANGVFGPGTKEGLKNNTLLVGSSGTWVNLFSAAMIFNRRAGVAFSGSFDSGLSARVSEFQGFVKLPVTGKGDFQTWASLLVSTGDPTRKGTACDCVTEVTAARAQTLRNNGYQIVGRYLSNVPGSSLNKKIQPGELNTIATNGLRAFPIYQTWGGSASYFTYAQGTADAFAAIEWARYYGFKQGTRIYFAVDFDALDYQVSESILPHFRGIRNTMAEHSREYQTGIYGPRNVCSRVGGEGLTSASFVSDMSTGFSGNLGYPMPIDWAFDQISTIDLGSTVVDPGAIKIDNNIASGRDNGQNSFAPAPVIDDLDVNFDMAQKGALLKDVQTYLESINIPETGGPAQEVLTKRSTTESFEIVMNLDGVVTDLARSFRMRKALIQCPLLWEIRKYNIDDPIADNLVESGVKNDSSTGLAQIFAATAIKSRNYCINQDIIGGAIMNPGNDLDLRTVWNKLHYDDIYNTGTVPLVLIEGANAVGIGRPGLNFSEDDSRKALARYNGTGDDAVKYGHQLIGLYKVFEKYHAPLRNK